MASDPSSKTRQSFSRRQLLHTAGIAGIGAAAASSGCGLNGILPAVLAARGAARDRGDVAMLKFLAMAELIEGDLWDQYNELAMGNDGYREALENIDEAMPIYIRGNTDDEHSHADFINAYLASIGET